MAKNRNIYGAVLCVESRDNKISWTDASGNLQKDDRFYIASVTKLYITTVILELRKEGALNLKNKITAYFPDGYLNGLHVLNGVDYTSEITITHLLANTSGIPDYFSHKQKNGRAAADELFAGKDEPRPLEKTLDHIKKLTSKFKPGQKGKAQYSDTNFQMLGKMIETVTGKELDEVFRERIFDELKLENTYVCKDVNDDSPARMYYKTRQLHLPNYMTSVTAEGEIVPTATELMIFLKAFFNGQFYFGIGLEKLWTPGFISPFRPVREILGCWGQSGAFGFHHPDTDLYFTGTVNQLSGFGHSEAFKAMLKIIKTAQPQKF
jgi:D-alanyl-D-alanine carboxypeptidase